MEHDRDPDEGIGRDRTRARVGSRMAMTDKDAAHGGRARFLLVRLRPVFADVLADLEFAQLLDDVRADEQRNQQRRKRWQRQCETSDSGRSGKAESTGTAFRRAASKASGLRISAKIQLDFTGIVARRSVDDRGLNQQSERAARPPNQATKESLLHNELVERSRPIQFSKPVQVQSTQHVAQESTRRALRLPSA